MFEKTLSDLVKGLRSNKRREAEYVSKCIAEIKEELQSKDKSHTVKANAVVKLAYLQMLGYDMQWASFHIVEVMSSPGFAQKRLGYLGASVSFNDETEVVLLCTNMFKKDFQDASPFVVGLAINCLANICTTDLARDLVADVVQLMNSNRAYVRKKAVLVMYKIFLKFPDALRPSFPKLKEKLEDRDTSTVSCAVNVICELARKNPQNYLALAPIFFKLLTHTANNWMLIKIVKLLGALCPLEPRLGKKLVEPLTNLINTTPAKSLLYEAIHTVSVGMTPHLEIVQLSMEKLKDFVEDEDQNLKYLGLLAMGNFMKVHPRIVAEHKTMILKCLNDEDITIRHRALDLVSGMVTKKNLQDIVRILMEHVDNSEGSFRHDLVDKIIEVSSANGYAAVTNFEWYITTLCKLARVPGVCNGLNLKNQLMDVIIRVRAVREFGVAAMVDILRDIDMLSQCSRDPTSAEVMYAAAWLVGEFSDLLEDSKRAGVMDSLLSKRVMCLPEHVQSVYLHSALKIYVSASKGFSPTGNLLEDESISNHTGDLLSQAETASSQLGEAAANPQNDLDLLLGSDLPPMQQAPQVAEAAAVPSGAVQARPANVPSAQLYNILDERLPAFEKSTLLEVQERACICHHLLELVKEAESLGSETILQSQFESMFLDELKPVAPKAQSKVPVPEGLDLDARIHDVELEDEPTEDESEHSANEQDEDSDGEKKKKKKKEKSSGWSENDFMGSDKFAIKPSKKELKKMQKQAEKERKKRITDPFYLGAKTASEEQAVLLDAQEVEAIPIFHLSDDEEGGKKKKRKSKKKKNDSDEDDGQDEPSTPNSSNAPLVHMGYEMPDADGDDEDANEDAGASRDELAAKLNVDLSKPLKASEVLPTIKQYERKSRYEIEEEERKKKKKEKKEKEKMKKEKKDKKSKEHEDDTNSKDDLLDFEKLSEDNKDSEQKDDLLDEISSSKPSAPVQNRSALVASDDLDLLFETKSASLPEEVVDKGGKKKESKKSKDHSSKRKDETESEEESEEEDKKSKKDKKKDSGKKDKKKKDKKEKSDKKSSKKDRESPREDQCPRLIPRSLGSDKMIKATYEAKAALDSNAKVPPVIVTVTLTNTGDFTLQPVSINVTTSMNVRLSTPPNELQLLGPGSSAEIRMELVVASVGKPHKVKCSIKYEATGEGAPAAPITVPCEMLLPCSSFLVARAMTHDEFNSLIGSNSTPHKSSAVIEAGGRPFKHSLHLLASLLNLRVVHSMDGAACLYAMSVLGHHVAVLAKAKGGSMVSVDMRCSDEALCQQLCNEVSGLPLFIAQ
mmetsp:Transcript_4752/g.17253  ORF Transcript_4752/g.17253 Transcript_4752/m.17253 type:complete len:1302 (-) Transcript_4752:63-3968(-)